MWQPGQDHFQRRLLMMQSLHRRSRLPSPPYSADLYDVSSWGSQQHTKQTGHYNISANMDSKQRACMCTVTCAYVELFHYQYPFKCQEDSCIIPSAMTRYQVTLYSTHTLQLPLLHTHLHKNTFFYYENAHECHIQVSPFGPNGFFFMFEV